MHLVVGEDVDLTGAYADQRPVAFPVREISRRNGKDCGVALAQDYCQEEAESADDSGLDSCRKEKKPRWLIFRYHRDSAADVISRL